MNRHPYSALFRPFDLSGEELSALENSIQANGIRNPITLYQGAILDGWNRYSAASRLGVNCPTKEFTGDDSEAWQFVLDENMHRRSLTNEQKAIIYLTKRQMDKQGVPMCTPDEDKSGVPIGTPSDSVPIGTHNKCSHRDTPPGESQSVPIGTPSVREIAKDFDLSHGAASRIKGISEKGSDALIEAVKAGDVSIGKAASVLDRPKEEQLAAAKTKAAKPEMVPAEKYAELKKQYEEAVEREKDLAYSLEAYTAVEEGEQEKLIKRLRVEIDTLKCRLNTVTTERNEAIRQSAWWKSEAKRLGWTAPR